MVELRNSQEVLKKLEHLKRSPSTKTVTANKFTTKYTSGAMSCGH